MDLATGIRKALDEASSYFATTPLGWTEWTREVHFRVGKLAESYADSRGIACGHPNQNSKGRKRVCVRIAGALKPAIDGAFLYDQCWLIYYDSKVEQENGYAT